ncbi:hypothetical protein HZ326_0132 [Fusarium oxysporum f. sp. albedinis]|nr:hypothetical protein HZ326_0132 [Fusarium oxysporum f. sp. albedinis]
MAAEFQQRRSTKKSGFRGILSLMTMLQVHKSDPKPPPASGSRDCKRRAILGAAQCVLHRRLCPPSTSALTSSLTYKQQNTKSAHIGTVISTPPILTILGASLLLTAFVTLSLPSFAFWLQRPAFWRATQLSLTFFGSLYNPPSRARRGQTLSLLSDRRRYPRAANT